MIILTGASGGIGKEIISHLLKIDCVVGIYNKSVPKSQKNKKMIYEELNLEDSTNIKSFISEEIRFLASALRQTYSLWNAGTKSCFSSILISI